MNAMREFEVVDANLRAALQFFGEATGSGEIRELDGVRAIYSGLDYGVFNIATLSAPVPAGSGGLEARIAECARFYKSRSERWSFWLCEELLEGGERRRARQAFAECGMHAISHPPGMLAASLRRPEPALPPIECRPVAEQAGRDAFAEITSACFDIPYSVSRAVYRPERAWQGTYRGYLALAGGKPVSIIALTAAAGVLGVYSLATAPEFRRRGYGEALLRAALAQERERTGLERMVLQSTEAGYRLYRRLGFRDVAKFSVYLTK
jgi:GNAT superfamily N-acetyltransferase